MRKVFIAAGVLAATLLVSVPPSALAQSWATTVWNQLQGQYDEATAQGYESIYYVLGRLRQGETSNWTFYLEEGEYEIRAACDGDCRDVDLRFFENEIDEVASDTGTGDDPHMDVEVMSSGSFDIEVEMYECSAEPCYYGLGVFYVK